ncbi:MAG TPA: BlaI/MecI/CopY family transcriptional regulator [Bryobacteraceae bacterium]|jgi:predicted transcriptional regulator|nr:BlaI/MecI/CopY family transcriptional regulator [Bryobacteraceae bacterium]
MARRKQRSESLTPLELKIMQVLWRQGPGNVQAIHKGLESDLAYTTVQTVLNVLFEKGRVRRTLKGRAYEYRTVASKESVLGQAVGDLIRRMFGGSSEELVMSLVKSRQIDPKTLARLSRRIEGSGEGGSE